MLRRLLLLLLLFAPCLLHAQIEGEEVYAVKTDTAGKIVVGADSLAVDSTRHRLGNIVNALSNIGFSDNGIIPKKRSKDDYWNNVPLDCHIKWRRKRARPFIDFCFDLAHYFNTYDTTYVERNHYNFRFIAQNTDFFQSFRLTARDEANGERQVLSFAPDHAYKIGPRAGWRWLVIGYTFGVVPSARHKASELNFAAYNSRIGIDFNWQHSSGPFSIRRIKNFADLEDKDVRGTELGGIRTNNVALNTYYVFNYRHFSYPAAYNASTVQLKNAGSWLLGVNFNYQKLSFDSDRAEMVLQQAYLDKHPEVVMELATKGVEGVEIPHLYDAMRISNINYKRIGVSFGYAYNWVPVPHLLISASAAPSFGVRKMHGESISKTMITDNLRNFHVDFIFRGSISYNRQRWFVGASAVSYLYDYRHTNFDLNNTINYLKIFVGVQFGKRKKFRLATDRSKW